MPEQAARKVFQRAQATKKLMQQLPSKSGQSSIGLTRILVPNPTPGEDPPWVPVTEPTKIEQALMDRNVQHFAQAQGTPMTTPEMMQSIPFTADSVAAEEFLKGNSPACPTYNEWADRLLKSCKLSHPPLTPQITLAEMKQKYKLWTETTSTSPSGRHLGHYHALLKPTTETGKEKEALDDKRNDIMALHHTMLQNALTHSHCYDRWKKVVTVMIEKDPGQPKLHRLRVIHLYEADFNLLLGIHCRKLDHHCEDHQLINEGCCARINKQAKDPALTDTLQADLSCLQRTPLIRFNNDASSCYDRIPPNLSNLCLRSFGMPKNVASIQGAMLQGARYHTRTSLGVSDAHYSHTPENPVFGTGQGSAGSPCAWGKIASRALDLHAQHNHGANYRDPLDHHQVKINMMGYVDDNNITVSSGPLSPSNTTESLIHKAQQDAQLWHDILHATGGALNLGKCFYQAISHHFTTSGTPAITQLDTDTDITIVDPDGNPQKIRNLSPFTSYRSLGFYQSMSGLKAKQRDVVKEKVAMHARKLAMSHVSARAAWIHYTSVFLPSVLYPLSLSYLPKSTLQDIQRPYTSILLNKMHFIRSYPRVVAFGPTSHGGLGLRDLYLETGADALGLILRHLRSPSNITTLLRVAISTMQFSSGVGYPILQYPSRPIPYLEGLWLPWVRSFLSDIEGSLEISNIPISPPRREGDRYLMEIAIDSQLYSAKELHVINNYRLYLRLVTLSDCCNASGTHILRSVLAGHTTQDGVHHSCHIYQERPSHRWDQVWKNFLRTLTVGNTLRLRHPLGPWHPIKHPSHGWWPYYLSPSQVCLYKRMDADSLHPPQPPRFSIHHQSDNNLYAPRSTELCRDLPTDAYPVDTQDLPAGWEVVPNNQPPDPSPPLPPPAVCWEDHLQSLPAHEKEFLHHVEWLLPPSEVATLVLTLSDILLATDGGAKDDKGSLGWVLCTEDGERLAKGSGTVTGPNPHSFRAEVCALHTGVTLVQELHRFYHPLPSTQDGQLTIHTDSESMIKKLRRLRTYPIAIHRAVLDSDWDVLQALHAKLQAFPTYPSINHVTSHQDNHKPVDQLPLPAQLNVEADTMATAGLQAAQPTPHVTFDPTCQASLVVRGATCTGDIKPAIRASHHLQPLLTYYNQRFEWSQQTSETIDWQIFQVPFRRQCNKHHHFTHKFCMRKLPLGQRLHTLDPTYDPRCPTCHAPTETDDHFLQCPHDSRKKYRQSLLSNLSHQVFPFMAPTLADIAREGITRAISPRQHPPIPPDQFPDHQQLLTEQHSIGWDNFLRGKLSKEWMRIQTAYELHQQTLRAELGQPQPGGTPRQPKTPSALFGKLLQTIWNAFHDLWLERCNDRHGRVQREASMADKFKADASLRALYELKDQVEPEDRHLFQDTVEEHLEGSTTNQVLAFVHRYGEMLKASVKQHADRMKTGTQPIYRLFQWKDQTRTRPTPQPPRQRTQRRRFRPQTNHLTNYFGFQRHRSTSQPPPSQPRTQLIRNPYARTPAQQWVPTANAPAAASTTHPTPTQRPHQGIRSYIQSLINFAPDHPS